MYETIARQYRLRLNLQLFAGEGGGSGGSGGNGGDGGNGGGAGGGEKTFTQAEVDAMMGQRLPRAEKAAQKALAKELGYDSVEAMQAVLKKPEGGGKGKDGDGATLTMEDVEKRAKELLDASQKEQSEQTFKRLLRAEVKVLASELGFADWEDAHALADLTKVTEDDKGNLTGVKEALEELLKKKPHLGKQKPGTGAFGAPVGGGGTPADKKAHQEALINSAKTRGISTTNSSVYDPWATK